MPTVYQGELEKALKGLEKKFQGKIRNSDYQDCLLLLLFYRTLSERWKEVSRQKDVIKREVLGYDWQEGWLFDELVASSKKEKAPQKLLEKIQAFKDIAQHQEVTAAGLFKSSQLFEDLLLSVQQLAKKTQEASQYFKELLLAISDLKLPYLDKRLDLLSLMNEYFINNSGSASLGKTGEYYTPVCIARLMSKLVCSSCPNPDSVYDPTCGTGILLRSVGEESVHTKHFYAQDINPRSCRLAYLNMLISDNKAEKLKISLGNVLSEPCEKWRHKRFDLIVANPPFSFSCKDMTSKFDQGPFLFFNNLDKVKRADFIFVSHMLYHLSEQGSMAVILPHGFLFRCGAEAQLRKELIEKYNYLDAIISLPAKLFYATKIATVLLLFKKNRRHKKEILFIEAKKLYQKGKKQNSLSPEHIHHLCDLYTHWRKEEGLAQPVLLKELTQKAYNLTVSLYVRETVSQQNEEDLESLQKKIQAVRSKRKKLEALIEQECVELGIPPPF